ncbi:unnamed protein product [Pylaiella littoralis]
MITDFEGFPKAFYSESSMNFEALFEYMERLESCGYEAEVVEAFAEIDRTI